jgi:HlyD family secretion protein
MLQLVVTSRSGFWEEESRESQDHMTKKKKLLVFGVVAFFIIWIGAVFWANHSKESRSDSADRKVAVYTIPDPQKVFGEGRFQYQNEVSFTPDASKGTVNKIHVQDGQKVDKGQLLFDYKNEQAIQQYQELEKELAALPAAAEGGRSRTAAGASLCYQPAAGRSQRGAL